MTGKTPDRRYAPTKGNQEKTDRIIDIIDIIRLAQTVAGWQAACEDQQNF